MAYRDLVGMADQPVWEVMQVVVEANTLKKAPN
jgi:hypothetical protein